MAAHVELTKEQLRACALVVRELMAGAKTALLVGPAGSGKTTCLLTILQYLRDNDRAIQLAAPTGKAARRMSETTGRDARTIHSIMYGAPYVCQGDVWHDIEERAAGAEPCPGGELIYDEARAPVWDGGVLVIDEASMVGKKLYGDMIGKLPPNARLLGLGDDAQLPPVNDEWGFDFKNPTAKLTAVHRQALESPILALATSIRTAKPWDGWTTGCDRSIGDVEMAARWVIDHAGQDNICLAYTHQTRSAINDEVRRLRGWATPIPQPGERLVVTKNNYKAGVINGDIVTVNSADPNTWHGLRRLYLSNGSTVSYFDGEIGTKPPISTRPIERIVDVVWLDWGNAITIHKSQGCQWDDVLVAKDTVLRQIAKREPGLYRRLAYVATSRAVRNLHVMELP